MASFEELPKEILRNIFQYLNGKELLQCGMVCRRFFNFTGLDEEWKLRCERDWNIFQLPQNFTTWKECYADMYERFGPYVTCYKRVSKCWEKIFAVTQERCPRVYASLRRDGIDEETLRRELNLESNDTKLPLEYRCSYRLCNGQSETFDGHFGLFGNPPYSAVPTSVFMCSYPGLDPRIYPVGNSSSSIRRCCLTFILITESSVWVTRNDRRKGPLALCVRDLETSPARRICQEDAEHERLNGSVATVYPNGDEYFLYGNSFIEFLENFADRIADYPVVNHRLLPYDFNGECDTGPFTVTVWTRFDQNSSRAFPLRWREFHFRYRITMRMHPEASQSDSCKLETQHWIITNADGKVKTDVEEPVLVDGIPVMRPGAHCTWSSGTSYSTPTGKISGYFTMRKLNTGGEIGINCPECHLVAPPYVRSYTEGVGPW